MILSAHHKVEEELLHDDFKRRLLQILTSDKIGYPLSRLEISAGVAKVFRLVEFPNATVDFRLLTEDKEEDGPSIFFKFKLTRPQGAETLPPYLTGDIGTENIKSYSIGMRAKRDAFPWALPPSEVANYKIESTPRVEKDILKRREPQEKGKNLEGSYVDFSHTFIVGVDDPWEAEPHSCSSAIGLPPHLPLSQFDLNFARIAIHAAESILEGKEIP